MKKRTDKKKSFGGILVLMALTLPVILMIASGAFIVLSYTVANEEIEASIKLTLLSAAEAYFAASCDGKDDRPGSTEAERDDCHEYKMSQAAARANEVKILHSKSLGEIEIGYTGDGTSPDAVIAPFRYQVEAPPEEDPSYDAIMADCTSGEVESDDFPCLLARKVGENDDLANAFTFAGTVISNHTINSLSNLFGFSFIDKTKKFFVKARAVPMRMCAVIDISRSSAYTTHPKNEDLPILPSYPLDADGNILRQFRGEPYDGYYNSWMGLDNNRLDNVPDTDPVIFYKDDYAYIKPFPDTIEGYDAYTATYPEFSRNHPNPAVSDVVDTGGAGSGSESWAGDPSLAGSYSGTSDQPAFLLDLYRYVPSSGDPNPDHRAYLGEEPWLSIMKGVHASFRVFRDRAVAGDKACIIFYNDRLTWKSIINLTDDFDYIQSVLDPVQIANEDNLLEHYNEAARWSGSIPNSGAPWDENERCGEAPGYGLNDANCMPLWARLGIFPITGTFTNSVVSIAESMRQFEEDVLDTPSTDLIMHFGDGLTSCFHNEDGAVCDSSRHKHYLRSMNEIEKIVNRGMRKNNISFHNFLVGDHVQPHTLNISDGNGGCLSDAEARKVQPDQNPVPFVATQGYNFWEMENETKNSNDAFNMYYNPPEDWSDEQKDAWVPVPFVQANTDWYNLVRMTGGIWAPLRPKEPYCDPENLPTITCSMTRTQAQEAENLEDFLPHMQKYDPYCRDTDQQVQDYLEEALKSASSFTIIQ